MAIFSWQWTDWIDADVIKCKFVYHITQNKDYRNTFLGLGQLNVVAFWNGAV